MPLFSKTPIKDGIPGIGIMSEAYITGFRNRYSINNYPYLFYAMNFTFLLKIVFLWCVKKGNQLDYDDKPVVG